MHLDLPGEYLVVAEIVAEAGQRRRRSLNAVVRKLPFFEKSVAMWLAIAAVPPLPMNISSLPESCAARSAVATAQPCS